MPNSYDTPVKTYWSSAVRRKALHLLALLLKRLDAWSLIVLESNFLDVLSACELELCGDHLIDHDLVEVMKVTSAFWDLPCQCLTCLKSLRWQFRTLHLPMMHMRVPVVLCLETTKHLGNYLRALLFSSPSKPPNVRRIFDPSVRTKSVL